MLDRDEVDALFPRDLPEPAHWEERCPPRDLPEGAQVTRFCPSPTGFAHIGGIYVAMIDKAIAKQSGGTYFIRIEDTDQTREVSGATAQFDRAFSYFQVTSEETDATGPYGPYTQSHRSQIYKTYVRQFLHEGKAYLCSATKEELAAATEAQRAAKVPTGYYGRWATWRDAPDDLVRERLAAGDSYVVRFRSPGEAAGRVTFVDAIRGKLEAEDNRNDIVILKSSANLLRLPTYHFAHAVDDHLMRVTLVIRAEEWISSVPVHLQLFDAAGFERIPYAHIAPLLKQDGSAKRKLSKRKDPEASVDFYVEAGYPPDGVLYYLRGLANGRLAEAPLNEALRAPLRLEECGVAGALVDLVKLEHITADLIATMRGEDIIDHVLGWANAYDPELARAVVAERNVALRALAIERGHREPPEGSAQVVGLPSGLWVFLPGTVRTGERPSRRPAGRTCPPDRPAPLRRSSARLLRPRRHGQVVRADPDGCRGERLRGQRQGIQDEPRGVRGVNPRSVAGHPRPPHRLHPQPGAPPRRSYPRRGRGAPADRRGRRLTAPLTPRPRRPGSPARVDRADRRHARPRCPGNGHSSTQLSGAATDLIGVLHRRHRG